MFPFLRLIALGLFVAALSSPLPAQPTAGPPDWQDGGSSVYLGMGQKAQLPVEAAVASSEPIPSIREQGGAASSAQQTTTSRKFDPSLVPSAHQEVAPPTDSSARRLSPPSVRQAEGKLSNRSGGPGGEPRRLVDFGVPTKSIYTVVTALTIVVGTFLIFAWVLRRGSRGGAGRGGILPAEAVSVLGRVRLTGRQAAELLRVGNKLVLVALTPSGAETLTEVTDPVEVDRLVGMCQQHDRHSTTKAFEQVFQQLSREPAAGGFFGADSLPASNSPVAAAYRSHRGDSTRG